MQVEIPNLEKLAPQIDSKAVREMVAANLYHTGQLSGKEARELVGVDRREFEEILLPTYGFSIFPDTDNAIANELTQ